MEVIFFWYIFLYNFLLLLYNFFSWLETFARLKYDYFCERKLSPHKFQLKQFWPMNFSTSNVKKINHSRFATWNFNRLFDPSSINPEEKNENFSDCYHHPQELLDPNKLNQANTIYMNLSEISLHIRCKWLQSITNKLVCWVNMWGQYDFFIFLDSNLIAQRVSMLLFRNSYYRTFMVLWSASWAHFI